MKLKLKPFHSFRMPSMYEINESMFTNSLHTSTYFSFQMKYKVESNTKVGNTTGQ